MEPTTLHTGSLFIVKLGDNTTHRATYICRDGHGNSRFHVFRRESDNKVLSIHEQYILNTIDTSCGIAEIADPRY